jgi:hypothetical protein
MTYRERQRLADIQAAAICPRNMRPDVHVLCGQMSACHAAN